MRDGRARLRGAVFVGSGFAALRRPGMTIDMEGSNR